MKVRVLLVAVAALVFTIVPSRSVTAAPMCNTVPTSGAEPRHPYLGPDAAAAAAKNPLYRYGENPYVYTLFVPEGLPDGPVPLLVGLHGLTSSARSYETRGLIELATREGFIVAFPSGARSWHATEDAFDVKFVRDVVADVRAERCIDSRRIWATGASNGGMMAQRLACDAADLFAAATSYAGTSASGTYPFGGPCLANEDNAQGFEPIPIALWHGTLDTTAAYEAGRSALRGWVNRYRCDTAPIEVLPTPFGPTERYSACNRGDIAEREAATGVPFEVQFRTFNNHPHDFPNGCAGGECESPGSEFPTADDLASEMFAFLARHARSTPAAEQDEPNPAAMPQREDPTRYAEFFAGLPDHGPRTDLVLVGEDGSPVSTADALRAPVLTVELVVHAPAGYPDWSLDNHPRCPSTTPGSRKVRVVGRQVTLRITDARGTTEFVAATAEQPGTGLAVASFPIEKRPKGTVVVETTVDIDRMKSHLLCTTRDARFQETVKKPGQSR